MRNERGLFFSSNQLTACRENDQAALMGRRQWPELQKWLASST